MLITLVALFNPKCAHRQLIFIHSYTPHLILSTVACSGPIVKSEQGGWILSPPFPLLPLSFFLIPLIVSSLSYPPRPSLRSRPLKSSKGVWDSTVRSGGDNFNNFPENPLTKFCAFYDYNTFEQTKATLYYSFTECMIYSYPF